MLLALDARLARRVGAITLIALALLSAGFVFLPGRLTLGTPARIRVMFRHSAGLIEHAPLVVGGSQIGRITAISPIPHGAAGPLAGEVGVAVTVELPRAELAKIPADSEIFVALRGALSDRYLEVAPPAGAPGPPIADGATLRGVDPPTLDNVLTHTWANLTTFRLFAETIRPELSALRAQLDRLRGDLRALAADPRAAGGLVALLGAAGGLAASARTTWNDGLGGSAGVAHLLATAGDARRTVGLVRRALAALDPQLVAALGDAARIRDHVAAHDPVPRAEHILADVRRALDEADAVLATAAELARRFADGEGSIGRLANDPELPEDTKDLGKYLKRHPWKFLERPAD